MNEPTLPTRLYRANGMPDLDRSHWRDRLVVVARNYGSHLVEMNADQMRRAGVEGLAMPFPVVLVEAIVEALGPRAVALLNAMETPTE